MNEKVKKPDLSKLENDSSMTNDEALIGILVYTNDYTHLKRPLDFNKFYQQMSTSNSGAQNN